MEVDQNDNAFATLEGYKIPYAVAIDCYTSHDDGQPRCGGPRGTCTVGLRGTGFAVSRNVTWKTFGYKAYMIENEYFERSVIKLRCGGWRGGCEPAGPFILDFDSNEDVPINSATKPICLRQN
ncbi:A disintegrin and metalloproteinase with thrombospondin motifs 20-like [Gigantopelta aegis]|uniref:A disintegrin and metalloproteinase with thrombospondin motifs 20-like n=1 Tax=Gigantopelta aegis TaxID=1735272 RepID=UPI001B8881FD|nr:A disintegrin and metalloproteinase with thrombospondin motifs 20-like [Gigantopelta aegis]